MLAMTSCSPDHGDTANCSRRHTTDRYTSATLRASRKAPTNGLSSYTGLARCTGCIKQVCTRTTHNLVGGKILCEGRGNTETSGWCIRWQVPSQKRGALYATAR